MSEEPNYASLARFRFIVRKFLAISAEHARSAGLSPQQHQLLLAIEGLYPTSAPTIGDLAKVLLIRHHTAVELVGRMERMGLVRRQGETGDRRRVLVKSTPKGRSVLQRLAVVHRNELRKAGPELVRALKRVLANDGTLR